MSDKPKPPMDSAAKRALKQERSIEGALAMSEYQAEREAERAKTKRLRALREAEEAGDRKNQRDSK